MGRTLVPRYLAALELSALGDAKLHELAGNVTLAGKTSPIVLASPMLQATIADLGTSDANLTADAKTVADDRTKLKADLAVEAEHRSLVVGALRTIVTLVTNVAKSPADLHSAGLPSAAPRPPKNQPPTVPDQITTRLPKKGHGKATVVVHEIGPTRHQYAAEQSLDGITFTPLGVGHGKTRVLTGASGTKVWVRFAMVRGQLQSEWSTPILVTIP